MMKKPVFAGFMLLWCVSAVAQDRSIVFEQGATWAQTLRLAREKERPIFVDCYTDWCGPCKAVAKNVFIVNEVADLFNGNFVNVKFEMEKTEDGRYLLERYGVRVFPTFLFIDPENEDLAYVKVGGGVGHQWLVDAARLAMDPQLNRQAMTRRYESGDRDPALVLNYIKLLGSLDMPAASARVTDEYLDSAGEEGMFTAQSWEIITLSPLDPQSRHFRGIVEGRRKFHDMAGEEEVDRYLSYSIRRAAEQVVHPIWEPKAFDRMENAAARHEALVEAYKGVDYPAAKVYLAFLEAASMVEDRRWDAMLDRVKAVDASGIMDPRETYDYFRFNLIPLARDGGSRSRIEKALAMIAEKIAESRHDPELNNFYRQLDNSIRYRTARAGR